MPDVSDRCRAIVALSASSAEASGRSLARAFFSDRVGDRWCHVVERVGGVALPALVRRVRKRAGSLPPATCARIARDLAGVQGVLDASAPGAVASVSDTVVTWDGRVVSAPRMFGAPADPPRWIPRDPIHAVGALLFALLAPELGDDVDRALHAALGMDASGVPRGAVPDLGAREIQQVVARTFAHEPWRRRVGRTSGITSTAARELAATLDDVVRKLGGDDDEAFAASLMHELFADRRREDLAWREELALVEL